MNVLVFLVLLALGVALVIVLDQRDRARIERDDARRHLARILEDGGAPL